MRPLHRTKGFVILIFCTVLGLLMTTYGPNSIRFLEGLIPMDVCPLPYGRKLWDGTDGFLDLWARTDVQTCTYWGAPIIWEGMFDPSVFDQLHKEKSTRVALTVFAVGRYLDAYLLPFLMSAEQYFMVGLPVTYYVFTDYPEKIPSLKLGQGRTLEVIQVARENRWQDVSMMRMKTITDAIDGHIHHQCEYVFCFDVDQIFTGRFGSEALGDSVALLHSFYYHRPKMFYTYDHNPKSEAYMDKGDFYYHAAVFGGRWQKVRNLTEACYQGIMKDKENEVEALWHDESHLNKYLFLHKPTKVLSPEYCWSMFIGHRNDIRVHRLLWAQKQYNALRN
ncbi:alpha-1,3-galactosyltransferase 2-like isoform X1 [Paramormyrops kingsleyae]|uniref:Alpha 1,3-galactosyltransferase 2 n=2 Tax=Paramormyrops kingsleyae TaxID=1676925 RepID=A0A3B3STA0_9TELE|nr:alpha-1,3-galactosyltransferase 2-like isoform X1 [Paramormyrops kingsleyae]